MKYINYYRNNSRRLNWEKFKNNPYTIDSINNNPYSNKFEEKYYKINKITKHKSNNNKGELTLEDIIDKIKNFFIRLWIRRYNRASGKKQRGIFSSVF